MTAYWIIAAAILCLQGVVLAGNYLYWKRRDDQRGESADVRLSVLVPARNEISNLPRLLTCLAGQARPAERIIVADDGSEDGTDVWLEEHAAELGVEWFRIEDKPEGWVGKSYACHRLAVQAGALPEDQGLTEAPGENDLPGAPTDWLLFLDADLEPGADFLAHLSRLMGRTEGVLFTAMPRLVPATAGDGLLIGMVPFTVFTMLPLSRAERPGNLHSAFANGQIMAFRSRDYARLRPHETARGALVEDVALARLVKSHGGRVHLADAGRHVTAHMYRNLGEAVDGFSKNAVGICGGVRTAVAVLLTLAALYLAPVGFALAGDARWWPLVALAAVLYGTAISWTGLPRWYGLLHLLALSLTEVVLARSILWHLQGRVRWKGRVYPG